MNPLLFPVRNLITSIRYTTRYHALHRVCHGSFICYSNSSNFMCRKTSSYSWDTLYTLMRFCPWVNSHASRTPSPSYTSRPQDYRHNSLLSLCARVCVSVYIYLYIIWIIHSFCQKQWQLGCLVYWGEEKRVLGDMLLGDKLRAIRTTRVVLAAAVRRRRCLRRSFRISILGVINGCPRATHDSH